jgi:hypothetical protein
MFVSTPVVLFINVLTDLIKLINPGLGINCIVLINGWNEQGAMHISKILFLEARIQAKESVAFSVKSGRHIMHEAASLKPWFRKLCTMHVPEFMSVTL